MIPFDSLALTVGIRFCAFEYAQWLLWPLDNSIGKLFPDYWKALRKCPYCHSFWIFLLMDGLIRPSINPVEIALKIPWALVASFLNLMVYFLFLLAVEKVKSLPKNESQT